MRHLPTHPYLRHPHTGLALQALGVTKSGRLIWPVLGGDDRDTGGTSGDAGSGSGGTGSAGDTGGTGNAGDGKAPVIDGDFDAERAKRAIAAAREGEAKAKATVKAEQDRIAGILKAAGLTADGKADPEQALKAAAEERDAAKAAARESAVQLAVYRLATKAGGDPDSLLDSNTFLGAVKDLDPEAADFSDKVAEAIKTSVKANPKLAATPAGQGSGAARQGADHTGGTGDKARSTDLTQAVRRKLGG